MRAWIIKKLFNSFLIKSTPVMITSWYGCKWYLIDHYNQMWRIRYTGEKDNPIIIELKEYL